MPVYDTVVTSLLGYGLASARPASLNIAPGVLGFYFATDTGTVSVWDGVWVALNTVALPAGITARFAGSLTATGTNQGSALALTAMVNIVTTTPSGTGVELIPAISGAVGANQKIINAGVNDLLVYPNSGDQISAFGTNTGVTLGPNHSISLWANAVNQWYPE